MTRLNGISGLFRCFRDVRVNPSMYYQQQIFDRTDLARIFDLT